MRGNFVSLCQMNLLLCPNFLKKLRVSKSQLEPGKRIIPTCIFLLGECIVILFYQIFSQSFSERAKNGRVFRERKFFARTLECAEIILNSFNNFFRSSIIEVMIRQLRKILIFSLVFAWIFSGWTGILQTSPFPSKIERVQAMITFERTPSEINIVSPVSISVSNNYPDDLIYDGSSGSVGLTREPFLNMKWWGIAVYTETENFISQCVPIAAPLPTAVFNLKTGDYKTEISLAETKDGCEAYASENFSGNVYPLFAVFETANFIAQ